MTVTHAGDGDRCLGDIGGEHDSSRRARRQDVVLLFCRECAVQRAYFRAETASDRFDLASGAIDLAAAWQEAEDVAGPLTQHAVDDRREGRLRLVGDRQAMRVAGDVHDRALVEESRDGRGIDRRRHHQHAQIIAREPRLPHQGKPEVGMHAALVEFIEHDRRDLAEQRVLLEPGGEDALGRKQHARLAREARLEADVPADLASEGPTLLLGDAASQRPRGGPSRLQHDDGAVNRQCGRHTRGLAGAGCRDEHGSAARAQVLTNRRHVRIDGECRQDGHGSH